MTVFGCEEGIGFAKTVIDDCAWWSLSDLGSDTALSRNLDGQVLDAGLLNWLGVEFHQRHYLLRHTHFDRQAQRAGFTGSQRVIMRPMAARKFFREGFSGRLSIRPLNSSIAPRLT